MIMEIKDLIQQHTANVFTVKVQMKTTVNYASAEINASFEKCKKLCERILITGILF